MTISAAASRSQQGEDLFRSMDKKKAKELQKAPSAAIQVGEHGRYQVKSGRLAGAFVARAFPRPPTKARGLIAEASGATEEAAIAALHDLIDARENRRTDERRIDAATGVAVPSVEEYVEAIRQVALSRPQIAVLTELSLAGEQGLAETRMASTAGYKSRASTNRSFASAGLLIADYLSVETAEHDKTGDPGATSLLGYRGAASGQDDHGNWILHPELREAVRTALMA
ncbi:MAG: hypothetical protein R6V44_05225 [Paracoccaceae bacterium]